VVGFRCGKVENLGGRMRRMKKRGPHVLYDLNDLLFSLQYCWAILNGGRFGDLRTIYQGCRALPFALAGLSCNFHAGTCTQSQID